jgi:hypothetical protein
MNEIYRKITQDYIGIVSQFSEQKAKFITIVLEDSNAKSKLQKFRQILLELQIKDNDKFLPSFDELSIEQLEFLTESLKKIQEPARVHRKLLDSIADVIRSDLSDDMKVIKITDLLL